MRYRWIIFGIFVVMVGLYARLIWEFVGNNERSTRPAQAQELEVPEEQSDGSLVFTGDFSEINSEQFDSVNTQPFELASGTITITVESDPAGNEPIVILSDESSSLLTETDDSNLTELVYENVAAGTYTLAITSVAAANLEGTYTITISEGSAPPPPTPPEETTQPRNRPVPVRDDDLLESGGTVKGPLPLMRHGSCPKQFPVKRGQTCNAE